MGRGRITPSRKRRKIGGSVTEGYLDYAEVDPETFNASSSSATDDNNTSESKSGTHSDETLRHRRVANSKDGIQSPDPETSISIQETVEPPSSDARMEVEEIDDDVSEMAKDFQSFKTVEIRGNTVTDKNTIDFIRVCVTSFYQITHPAEDIKLSDRTLSFFMQTLHHHGFLQHFKFDGKTLPRFNKGLNKDRLSTVTINLDSMCKDMDKFIDAINNFYWTRYYIVPKNINEMPRNFRMCFNQNLIETIKQLHKAINNNEWRSVGHLIGEIDIDKSIVAGNNSFYAHRLILCSYALLWENLFFVCYQRILFHEMPHRMKAILLEQVLKKFHQLILTEMYKFRKLLPLFKASTLIFGIAHNNRESIKEVMKIQITGKFNDAELNSNLRVYQFYGEYQELLEDPNQPEALFENLFQNILEFLENTPKKHASLLFILEPFIVLAKEVEETDRAMEMLCLFCQGTPALVPFVASILDRCGLSNLVGRLISECLEHDPNSTFLHRFPLVTHYIEQRTIQAGTRGTFRYEEAEKHVKMLFNFFDYGKNRSNSVAWVAFKYNLQILAPFPDWVYDEWADRADWWPRFHLDVPLDAHQEDRASVFQMFQKCNPKSKLL